MGNTALERFIKSQLSTAVHSTSPDTPQDTAPMMRTGTDLGAGERCNDDADTHGCWGCITPGRSAQSSPPPLVLSTVPARPCGGGTISPRDFVLREGAGGAERISSLQQRSSSALVYGLCPGEHAARENVRHMAAACRTRVHHPLETGYREKCDMCWARVYPSAKFSFSRRFPSGTIQRPSRSERQVLTRCRCPAPSLRPTRGSLGTADTEHRPNCTASAA